jgi:hypothetical protein
MTINLTKNWQVEAYAYLMRSSLGIGFDAYWQWKAHKAFYSSLRLPFIYLELNLVNENES